MLLIHPPVAKPCEPPAGIAKLAGALKAGDFPCRVLDGNLEGLLFLCDQTITGTDAWTRRAAKNVRSNLAALRDRKIYATSDRYGKAVREVHRVLQAAGASTGSEISLTDFHHHRLSPLRSADLIAAAEQPDTSPFYPWFSRRLPEEIVALRSSGGTKERAGANNTAKGCRNADVPYVGFSLNFLSQALTSFAMIGFIKRHFPDVKIILGGGLVTSWMRRPGWTDPFHGIIDHLIPGPGEGPLLALLGSRERSGGSVASDYSDFPLDDYLSPGFILPYSASSGCYWRKCSFCPEAAENNVYAPLPADRAHAELRALISRHRPVLVHLLDNAVSPALMRSLANDPVGVPWYGFARFTEELIDAEFCAALKRSGCMLLKLGLESGDQHVLDKLNKGIDLEKASLILRNLKACGIATYIYLLFGTPVEDAVAARRTLDFVVRHRDAITFLNCAVFNMPLGCDVSEKVETRGFYEGDLSLYTAFRHPLGWDRRSVKMFLDREFRRHPVVADILRSDPPFFTSNHAAFFVKNRG